MTSSKQELREQLADIEHQRWADWQRYCHKVLRENNPSPEQGDILERWDRQIETPYSELSEKEKDLDREQVNRYWKIIEEYISDTVNKVLDEVSNRIIHSYDVDEWANGMNFQEENIKEKIEKLKQEWN